MKKLLTLFIIVFLFSAIKAQTTLNIKPNAAQGKDAWVWSGIPNSNYGTNENLVSYTWTNGGNLALKRIYIAFDLSMVPANAIIDSVFLDLFFATSSGEGFFVHSGNTSLFIEKVSSPWNENNITWNNQPISDSSNRVSLAAHTNSSQDYHMDVTALFDTVIIQTNPNNGLMLRMQDEVNYYNGLLFASSDHPNSTLRPSLEVNYHLATTIKELGLSKEDLNVFPNPSSGKFFFEMNKTANMNQFNIKVLDIIGAEVETNINYNAGTIEMSNFSSGVYFLLIEDDLGGVITKKLLVQ